MDGWSEEVRLRPFPPMEEKGAVGLPHSTRPWVVEVDIASGKISCIKETADRGAHVRLTGLEWQIADQQLVLRYFDAAANSWAALKPEIFHKENGSWTVLTDPA